jgi:hypothetical protein
MTTTTVNTAMVPREGIGRFQIIHAYQMTRPASAMEPIIRRHHFTVGATNGGMRRDGLCIFSLRIKSIMMRICRVLERIFTDEKMVNPKNTNPQKPPENPSHPGRIRFPFF